MRKSLLVSLFAATVLMGSAVASYGEEISPSSVTDSGCKGFNYAPPMTARVYGEEQPSWTVRYNDGKLVIIWHDYIADCAAYDFESKITRDGDKLVFTAWSKDGGADCICPYDVTATYEGIAPGRYKIVFGSPWQEMMSGEINLQEGYSALFNSTQVGIDSIAASERMLSVEEGVVMVNCTGKFRLDIFNADGVKEFTLEDNASTEVSLGALPRGMHYLRLTPAEGKAVTLPVLR